GAGVCRTIVAILLRFSPSLVWYRVYAPLAGRMPVPALADLSWPWAERCTYALLTTGTMALALPAAPGDARWIQATGFLVLAGALTFALAIGAPMSRLGRRGIVPPATGPAHSSA